MKKVVSIALFGDSTASDGSGMGYHQYLITFCIAHLNLFPIDEGWELRLFVDDLTVGKTGYHHYDANGEPRVMRFANRLHEVALIKVKHMGPAIRTKAMLWRMQPIFETDADADYVFCRDLDACPMPRDRAACEQFIVSDTVVHTIHDNVAHAGVMGGLCGFRAETFREHFKMSSLDDLYRTARVTDEVYADHGTDQVVLNRLICRAGGPTLLEHRFNGWHSGPGAQLPRDANTYECPAWSARMPDVGTSRLSPELAARADRLANHLGAAGYDHLAARAFWEEHGDPEITRMIRECER